ncbi:hypothetical protein D3C77_733880 [compost metagenome]
MGTSSASSRFSTKLAESPVNLACSASLVPVACTCNPENLMRVTPASFNSMGGMTRVPSVEPS